MSPFYNNTLGVAGVIRLNSGDSKDVKAITTSSLTEGSTTTPWTLIHAGANSTLSTSTTGDCNNGGTGSFGTSAGCRYYVEKRTRTDSKTATKTWDASGLSNAGVLRLSTRETSDSGNLITPAINGGVAPTFDANEGVYLYNPNINLVLGTLYQPLILGSDGKNFSLEIARIANKPEIYKQIYTDYSGVDTSYKGSTCNVYQCGNQLTLGGKNYQGYNATHSSITIGTAFSEDGGKTLRASTDEGAVGISFGKLNSGTVSRTTYSNQMTEVHYKQRGVNTQTWVQSYSCTLFICGAGTTGYLYQWEYNNGSTPWAILAPTTKPTDATCSPTIGCSSTSGTTPMYGSIANRVWANSSAVWLTAANNEVNNLIGANNGMTGTTFPTLNQAPTPVINSSPINNLGSAVIDGVLIQHLKLTTKGLKEEEIDMKKISTLILALCATVTHAELQTLDNEALQAINGQAGADLSLMLNLNQTANGVFDNGSGGVCENVEFCHIGLAINKRFVQADATKPSGWAENSDSGNKLWLVFKGVQGTLNIQKMGLDGADLKYLDKNNTEIIKPAIQLSFSAAQPILIRNFGFNALSIEQDNFTSSTTAQGSSANMYDYAYFKKPTYAATANSANQQVATATPSAYDHGRETGFMGLMMNGNLAIQGKVMVFSCDGSHPRC